MAITFQRAIDAAIACVGSADKLERHIKYGPLTQGYARMYEFKKAGSMPMLIDGYVSVLLIDERTGENVASSSFPGIARGDYEVLDFAGNVVFSREEVRTAWEAEKKRQAELDAQAEAEGDESLEPVPVERDRPQGKFV